MNQPVNIHGLMIGLLVGYSSSILQCIEAQGLRKSGGSILTTCFRVSQPWRLVMYAVNRVDGGYTAVCRCLWIIELNRLLRLFVSSGEMIKIKSIQITLTETLGRPQLNDQRSANNRVSCRMFIAVECSLDWCCS